MLLSRYVITTYSCKNKSYFEQFGYTLNKRMKVSVEHLQKGSNASVSCRCDVCNKKYIQRFSRDHDVCGDCKAISKMKGNNYGSSNRKVDVPSKEELLTLLNDGLGKQEIARKYNTTLIIVGGWMTFHSIKVERYKGLIKVIPVDFEKMYNELKSIKKLEKYYKVSYTLINRWLKENNIKYIGVTSKKDRPTKDFLFDLNYNKKFNTKMISALIKTSDSKIVRWFSEYDLPIKQYGKNTSKAETEIIEYLNSLGCNFSKRKRVLENTKLELDGYDFDLNVAIEFNGLYWHSSDRVENNNHVTKYIQAKDKNIKLYTIFENEWLLKKDLVKSMLVSRVGKCENKIGARKTVVKKLSEQDCINFLNDNHISGFLRFNTAYGLFYNNVLLSVMTFNKPRFNKHYEWEIGRFASLQNYSIAGGANKLLKHFIKEHKPKNILSYADLRWGSGDVYEKCGFVFDGLTPPNYFYFKNRSYLLESRVKYQKHKLAKIFYECDMVLTESEIMRQNDYSKIYDCGNAKWVWKVPT